MQESQTEKEMRRQQRVKVMTDMTQENQVKGQNGRKQQLVAADWQKAWFHQGWRDTMLQWYSWLYEMKKNDEEQRMEVEHQKLVSRMIKSADGGTGLLHKKIPSQRRGEEECRF